MSPPTAPLWLLLAHVVVSLSYQNVSNGGNLPVNEPVQTNVTTQNGTFPIMSCQDGEINVTSVWIRNTDCIKTNEKLRLIVSRCNGFKDCPGPLVNVEQQMWCEGSTVCSDTVIAEFECIEGPDATSKATTDMTSQSAAMTSPGVTQITVSGLTGATGDGSSGGGPEAATTDMTSQSAAMMSPGVTQSTVSGLTGATDDSGFLGVYIGAGCAVMILLAAVITSLIVYLKRRRRHRAASDQTTGTPHELRSHADHVVNAAENEYSETGPSKNSTQQVTMATAHPSETYTEVRFRRESDDPSDLVLRENAIYGQAEEYPPQHDGKPQHDGGGFSRQANNDESEAFLPRIAREGPEVPPPHLVDGMDPDTLKTPADDELFMDENDMYGSS